MEKENNETVRITMNLHTINQILSESIRTNLKFVLWTELHVDTFWNNQKQ